MAIKHRGAKAFTVQESTAPYLRKFNPDADTEYPVCRACINSSSDAATNVTITFMDGSTLVINNWASDEIKPLAAIKTSSSAIDFLY
tara:strand:- start:557 stop:817 length:261 start_codon:yes stop_codon:yes gene_type:complete